MTQHESLLEQLVVDGSWQPSWKDVLTRAGEAKRRRLISRTRLLVALAVAAAVLVPLVAVAAANDWWFFRTPGSPIPASAPVVVKTGVWDSHPWQLVAYPSSTDGLCFSFIPGTGEDASSYGAAMSCGPFRSFHRTAATKRTPDMTITYLFTSATSGLPAHIVGPVIESATTVQIQFTNGMTTRTQTFAGPAPLDHVRFYAVPLPAGRTYVPATTNRFAAPIEWIAGLDHAGHVVACLVPADANKGISPLSACRR